MEGERPLLIYRKLREHFGFRDWWPGDTDFEVFVGAILTQQTSWRNVEKAITNLKEGNALSIRRIASMRLSRLESIIRPSGFYKQKAKRLKNICTAILKDHGSFERMLQLDQEELRKILLSYNGIGRETADSIILYAAHKPSFVIDAYTKRTMHRIDPSISNDIDYDHLKGYFEGKIGRDVGLYKDFHAQFVELGKNYCRKSNPDCAHCPLNRMCRFGIKQRIRGMAKSNKLGSTN